MKQALLSISLIFLRRLKIHIAQKTTFLDPLLNQSMAFLIPQENDGRSRYILFTLSYKKASSNSKPFSSYSFRLQPQLRFFGNCLPTGLGGFTSLGLEVFYTDLIVRLDTSISFRHEGNRKFQKDTVFVNHVVQTIIREDIFINWITTVSRGTS